MHTRRPIRVSILIHAAAGEFLLTSTRDLAWCQAAVVHHVVVRDVIFEFRTPLLANRNEQPLNVAATELAKTPRLFSDSRACVYVGAGDMTPTSTQVYTTIANCRTSDPGGAPEGPPFFSQPSDGGYDNVSTSCSMLDASQGICSSDAGGFYYSV